MMIKQEVEDDDPLMASSSSAVTSHFDKDVSEAASPAAAGADEPCDDDAADQLGGGGGRQRKDNNSQMSVTLKLDSNAAENIGGVMAAIADLLKIAVPPSYEVSRSPSPPLPRHPPAVTSSTQLISTVACNSEKCESRRMYTKLQMNFVSVWCSIA